MTINKDQVQGTAKGPKKQIEGNVQKGVGDVKEAVADLNDAAKK